MLQCLATWPPVCTPHIEHPAEKVVGRDPGGQFVRGHVGYGHRGLRRYWRKGVVGRYDTQQAGRVFDHSGLQFDRGGYCRV